MLSGIFISLALEVNKAFKNFILPKQHENCQFSTTEIMYFQFFRPVKFDSKEAEIQWEFKHSSC